MKTELHQVIPVMAKSTSLETLLLVMSYSQESWSPRSAEVTMLSWCWMITSLM